jgi:regulator of cell morphogenesis and NO signaling
MSTYATQDFANRTLADIAATLPGATNVFRRIKLDFCCGGRVPLAEAVADKGLDLAPILAELDGIAAASARTAVPQDTDALIELIETRYHASHRRDLPELLRLARRVEAVHAAHPEAPAGLGAVLQSLSLELHAHMDKEEQILFPMMRMSGHPMIGQPIAVMLAEHDDAGAQLREIERITKDFAVPEDACPTWAALVNGAKKFTDDLMEHIHLENNVLFPRFAG